MTKKQFLFIRLATLIGVAVVFAVGFPAQAHADGTSPGQFASADSSGPSISGKAAGEICTARFGGREIFCHHLDPASESVDTTPPRGDDDGQFAAGYIDLLRRPFFAHVSAYPALALRLPIPRFLFGSFRS